MEIRKYTYVDVFFNSDEVEKANLETKRLEKLGYNLEVEDDGNDTYEMCNQFLRYSKFVKK